MDGATGPEGKEGPRGPTGPACNGCAVVPGCDNSQIVAGFIDITIEGGAGPGYTWANYGFYGVDLTFEGTIIGLSLVSSNSVNTVNNVEWDIQVSEGNPFPPTGPTVRLVSQNPQDGRGFGFVAVICKDP